MARRSRSADLLRTGARVAQGTAARLVLGPALRYEWRHGIATYTERLFWYADALAWLTERYPRTVLDVGTSTSAWPQILAFGDIQVTAIDAMRDPAHPRTERLRFFNRHWHVLRADATKDRLGQEFDFVTCFSVLELVEDVDAAVAGLFAHVKPGGFVVVSTPYNERVFVENAYALPDAGYGQDLPWICRQHSRAQVDRWLEANDAVLIDQHFYRCFSGPFWTMGERLRPAQRVTAADEHHMSTILFRRRAESA